MGTLEESVAYFDADTALTGLLVHPQGSIMERAPIVLLHGGAGLDDHARSQARRYATRGHPVLAADLYGPGVAGDRDRVLATIGNLRSQPGHLSRRVRAAVDAAADTLTAPVETITVIGFCLGGTAALELARARSTVAGVVSIHGGLATTRSAQPGDVRTRILVCHGGSDPHIPPDEVAAFLAEMAHAGADWQLIVYGPAQHGFTHVHDDGRNPGVRFDPEADTRAHAATCRFLDEGP